MPITKRTLEKWRKEALKDIYGNPKEIPDNVLDIPELQERILRLTQALLDQELMKK